MKNVILFGLLFAVLIAGGVYYFSMWRDADPNSIVIGETEVINSDSLDAFQPSTADRLITATPDTSVLRAGGSSYLDSKGVYSFLYPSDYTLDMQNDGQHTRIMKRGISQRPQSEMSDGALIVFEALDLQGQTLEQWVDAHIQTTTADGTSELVQPKKAITLNDYPGFTYEIRGLGSATYIVVQKDTNSSQAANITYLVADPNQVGYQSEVEAILSTVQVLK